MDDVEKGWQKTKIDHVKWRKDERIKSLQNDIDFATQRMAWAGDSIQASSLAAEQMRKDLEKDRVYLEELRAKDPESHRIQLREDLVRGWEDMLRTEEAHQQSLSEILERTKADLAAAQVELDKVQQSY